MTSTDLPKIDPKRLAGWMGVTLYVGGAVKVASPEQRERIQREILPLLRDDSVPVREVLQHVDTIMGDWTMPRDFDTAINSLLS